MAALMSLLPQANAVSVGFSGIVTAVRQGTLTTGIAVGSVFTGTLTYDPISLDMDPNPEVGKYMPSASAAASADAGSSAIDYWTLTMNVGPMLFYVSAETAFMPITILNTPVCDALTFAQRSNYPNAVMSINLFDSFATALSSDALPPNMSITDWETGSVGFFGGSAFGGFDGTIFTSAVPDRSNTIALLGCGVVPLVVIFELCRRNSGRADRSSSGLRRK